MAFSDTLKALSDPARRRILTLLKDGKMSAGEISENFDMTDATVSYHLKILKNAGLVSESRKKNFVFYELNTSVVEDVMKWLAGLKERDL